VEEFRALCRGEESGGNRIISYKLTYDKKTGTPGEKHRAGNDCIFSSPSRYLSPMPQEGDAVKEAHDAAVVSVAGHLERHYSFCRTAGDALATFDQFKRASESTYDHTLTRTPGAPCYSLIFPHRYLQKPKVRPIRAELPHSLPRFHPDHQPCRGRLIPRRATPQSPSFLPLLSLQDQLDQCQATPPLPSFTTSSRLAIRQAGQDRRRHSRSDRSSGSICGRRPHPDPATRLHECWIGLLKDFERRKARNGFRNVRPGGRCRQRKRSL